MEEVNTYIPILITGLLAFAGTYVTKKTSIKDHEQDSRIKAIEDSMEALKNQVSELIAETKELKENLISIKEIFKSNKEILKSIKLQMEYKGLIIKASKSAINDCTFIKNEEVLAMLRLGGREVCPIFENIITEGFDKFNENQFLCEFDTMLKHMRSSVSEEKMNIPEGYLSEVKTIIMSLAGDLSLRITDYVNGAYNGESDRKMKEFVAKFITECIKKPVEHYQEIQQLSKYIK